MCRLHLLTDYKNIMQHRTQKCVEMRGEGEESRGGGGGGGGRRGVGEDTRGGETGGLLYWSNPKKIPCHASDE